MSDYDDRGAYTPPSDRLAFDPRTPVRGGGPAPVTLIVSGLVLASLVGGVFFLYRDGFKHREAPALVGAPVVDVRTPAEPQPATAAPPAPAPSLVVDKTSAPAPAPAFAPPPAHAALPPAPPPIAAAPATPAVAKPPQVVMLAPDAPPKPAAAPAPKLAVAPAPKLAAAAPPPTRPVVRHSAAMTIASLADDALSRRAARSARATREDWAARDDGATWDEGATRDSRRASGARIADAQPAAPAAQRAAVAKHIKGAELAAAAPRIVAGPTAGWVQIGAFSSPTLAEQGWRDIARLEPAAMAGKGKALQPLGRDDGTTLYRTYVTGFKSVSAAQAFCAELQATGKACMVK